MESKFAAMLKNIKTESDMITLSAKLMAQGCWETVADMVMDRCNEIGGESMEDSVYNKAWAISASM